MFIYCITNKINGKQYIGQTHNSIYHRFNQHYRDISKKMNISKALRKYGRQNFQIDLLQICESQEELDRLEQKFILQFNTLSPNGYNLVSGGQSGRKASEETKNKMRLAKLGKPSPKKGKKTGPISVKYNTINRIGLKQSKECVEKRIKKLRGQKRSNEHKKKMSEARLGKTYPTGKCRFTLVNKKTGVGVSFYSPKHAELLGYAKRSAIANVLSGLSKELRNYYVYKISTQENESVG